MSLRITGVEFVSNFKEHSIFKVKLVCRCCSLNKILLFKKNKTNPDQHILNVSSVQFQERSRPGKPVTTADPLENPAYFRHRFLRLLNLKAKSPKQGPLFTHVSIWFQSKIYYGPSPPPKRNKDSKRYFFIPLAPVSRYKNKS